MIALLASMLRIFWPYALAATGGLFSERAGVINLALEGFLLWGAFLCATFALASGSATVGIIAALVGGVLHGLTYLWLAERFRSQQVLLGIAFNLTAAASTRFALKLLYGSASNSPHIEASAPMGVIAAIALAIAALVLGKSVLGTRICAAGDNPAALRALKLSVLRPRMAALAATGMLTALGGAALTLGQHQYTDNMSAGRGYIAVAAVIFGSWRLRPALLACLLFAAAEAGQFWAQGRVPVPPQLLQALPYLICLAALSLRRGNARAPAALSSASND